MGRDIKKEKLLTVELYFCRLCLRAALLFVDKSRRIRFVFNYVRKTYKI